MSETEIKKPKITKASKEEFLAVQLHQAREACNGLRQSLLVKEKQIADLSIEVGQLRQVVYQLETQATAQANASLRAEYKLEPNKTIQRDEATGDYVWIADEQSSPVEQSTA